MVVSDGARRALCLVALLALLLSSAPVAAAAAPEPLTGPATPPGVPVAPGDSGGQAGAPLATAPAIGAMHGGGRCSSRT